MVLDLDQVRELQQQAESQTGSKFRKLKRFLRLAVRGFFVNDVFSELEHYILQQPNDCSIVSQYSCTKKIGICSLSCLHIPSSNSDAHKLPVVLFLHGLGGQMSQFESFFSLFTEKYDVFSLDLPGFGNSKGYNIGRSLWKPNATELEEIQRSVDDIGNLGTSHIVDIISQYVKEFIGDREMVIVAHSMGTHLATKVTNRMSHVKALVLISPPRFVETRKSGFLRLVSRFPSLFKYLRIWDRLEGLESHSLLRQVDPNCTLEKKARQLRWNLDINSRTVLEYVKGFKPASSMELLSACEKVGRSHCRVMIMCGENDSVTPIACSEEASRVIQEGGFQVSFKRIKQCGHAVLLERPEIAASTALEFIS